MNLLQYIFTTYFTICLPRIGFVKLLAVKSNEFHYNGCVIVMLLHRYNVSANEKANIQLIIKCLDFVLKWIFLKNYLPSLHQRVRKLEISAIMLLKLELVQVGLVGSQ